MMKKGLILGSAVLVTVAVAQSMAGLRLSINGKSVTGTTIVVKGETYIPLSALKSAGATTSINAGTLSIALGPAGGANQVAALEGKVGDWLFNGLWRFKVISVDPNDDGRPGWKVHVELRNGTKLDSVALGGTGLDSISLVMAGGDAIRPYNITDIDRPIGQGGSADVNLVFYDDEGNGRKPEKLVLRIQPDAATKSFLKAQGVAYTTADPSFRVNLKKN